MSAQVRKSFTAPFVTARVTTPDGSIALLFQRSARKKNHAISWDRWGLRMAGTTVQAGVPGTMEAMVHFNHRTMQRTVEGSGILDRRNSCRIIQ